MRTKKMFLFFAAFLFAAVAGYNIHLAQTQNSGDISLADIAVMAQADGESGGGIRYCYPTVQAGIFFPRICKSYNPGNLPPWECGGIVWFAFGASVIQQCY